MKGRELTVINAGTHALPWLACQSPVNVVHSDWEGALNDPNVLILSPASRLATVAPLVHATRSKDSLRAVIVENDVGAGMLAQVLHSTGVRTLARLLAHTDFGLPKRVVNAWRIGSAGDLIASAAALPDKLLVVSCDVQRIEVPWDAIHALARLPEASRTRFDVHEYGSYLHWPEEDIHLDLESLRVATVPDERRKAERLLRQHNARLGAAIRELRLQADLRQSDIDGLSARQVRRVEQGHVRPRVATYQRLAAAHGRSLSDYLDRVAELSSRPGVKTE
jgi:hypothetical protein